MKGGAQLQRQNVSSSNYHSAFHQRQSSIKRHPYYPYQNKLCQQPNEPSSTHDNLPKEPKDDKRPPANQESSLTEQLAAALVRSSAALTNPLRIPPPIPPRPLPFRVKNAQPLSNTSDKGDFQSPDPPKQKLILEQSSDKVQPPKIPDQKMQLPLTARPYGNPKEILDPPSSESLPSTPRPSFPSQNSQTMKLQQVIGFFKLR
jgi:hypothetical protein